MITYLNTPKSPTDAILAELQLDAQITALKASIAHWNDNLIAANNGMSFSIAAQDCACCAEWYYDCKGCPICQYTGNDECIGSPYDKVAHVITNYDQTDDAIPDNVKQEIVDAVTEELLFLKWVLYNLMNKPNNVLYNPMNKPSNTDKFDIQIDALEASIKRWNKNLVDMQANLPVSLQADDCPCCILFFDNECNDCPICEYTGYKECDDTPYREVLHAKHNNALEEAATIREIEFLKKVLTHVKALKAAAT
jgi:hypothetical protein